jgi:AraC-like DNA-binding protein
LQLPDYQYAIIKIKDFNCQFPKSGVFANMLNITPKYLSKCVKDESGRSPIDLIHETTAGTIRQQLRYSNKTVKEICTELDFPNLSFFGKFVKEHLGMSPTEYRQQNLNHECRLHPDQGIEL